MRTGDSEPLINYYKDIPELVDLLLSFTTG
jgi:hypothetical protein